MLNLKDKLKFQRITKGWTQEEVADMINVSRPSYARYETGASTPPLETLVKLAELYDVTTDYLLDHNTKGFLKSSFKQGIKAGENIGDEILRKKE